MIQGIDKVAKRQVEKRCTDRRIHTSTGRHCHDLSSGGKDWHERLATKGTETTEQTHSQSLFGDGVSRLAEARTGQIALSGPNI